MSRPSRLAAALLNHPTAQRWDAIACGSALARDCPWLPVSSEPRTTTCSYSNYVERCLGTGCESTSAEDQLSTSLQSATLANPTAPAATREVVKEASGGLTTSSAYPQNSPPYSATRHDASFSSLGTDLNSPRGATAAAASLRISAGSSNAAGRVQASSAWAHGSSSRRRRSGRGAGGVSTAPWTFHQPPAGQLMAWEGAKPPLLPHPLTHSRAPLLSSPWATSEHGDVTAVSSAVRTLATTSAALLPSPSSAAAAAAATAAAAAKQRSKGAASPGRAPEVPQILAAPPRSPGPAKRLAAKEAATTAAATTTTSTTPVAKTTRSRSKASASSVDVPTAPAKATRRKRGAAAAAAAAADAAGTQPPATAAALENITDAAAAVAGTDSVVAAAKPTPLPSIFGAQAAGTAQRAAGESLSYHYTDLDPTQDLPLSEAELGADGLTSAGAEGLVKAPDHEYVEVCDAQSLLAGSALFTGSEEEWHRHHVREVLSVPARGPGVELPSRELFRQQLILESQCRSLALEEYRRELGSQVARGVVERSLPAKRLMSAWVPQLTERLEELVAKFLSLKEDSPTTTSLGYAKRGLKVSQAAASESLPESQPPTAAAAPEAVTSSEAAAAPPSLSPAFPDVDAEGSLDAGSAMAAPGAPEAVAPGDHPGAEAGEHLTGYHPHALRELSMWVPLVLPLPAQLLARTALAAVLNALVVGESTVNDLPPGVAPTVAVADSIGRRVHDLLAYMEACEMVAKKRREVQQAAKTLKISRAQQQSQGAAAGLQEGGAAAGGGSDGSEGGGLRQEQAAADVAENSPTGAPIRSSSSGVVVPPDQEMERRFTEAVDRLQEAQKQLEQLRIVACFTMPSAAAGTVLADGTNAAARQRVARSRCRQALRVSTRRALAKSLEQAGRVREWEPTARVQVGSALLHEVLSLLRVRDPETGRLEPALSHSVMPVFKGVAPQAVGMVVAHPQMLRRLEGDEELRRLLQPRFMPMVVEPRPWTNMRAGGALTQTATVIKTRYSPRMIETIREAHQEGRMTQLYDALTVLGNVPWRVNAGVLRVMEQVVAAGGGLLAIPSVAQTPLPQPFTTQLNDVYREFLDFNTPAQCGTPHLRLQREGLWGGQLLVGSGAMSPGEAAKYQKHCEEIRELNRKESGMRSAFLYKLEIARQYAGRGAGSLGAAELPESAAGTEVAGSGPEGAPRLPPLPLRPPGTSSDEPVGFFHPHHVDFRGRAYPLHPHLMPLGDDTTRGLLQFGVGRPLGQRGLRWLLIQVANQWGRGVDKLSLEERHDWAKRMLPAIRASAERPLPLGNGDIAAGGGGGGAGAGGAWWQGGERPWQLLATCMEIDAALRNPGGPEAYVSYHPVAQDGTCNGLQHYAALGRDRRGGAAVNLLPADRPQDVYQAVATAVAERVERDREQGRSEAAKIYGSVDRKLVKQTVMTYVYGVTIVGAREQIECRLEERGWTNPKERRKVAQYMARLTFDSMGDVFGPAVEVRSWLEACAKHAASSGNAVMWTSPLGFPVEQPYRKLPFVVVRTALQRFNVRDNRTDFDCPIDSRRQRSGFAPNYVHSLDGAHMMMTAMAMRRRGACFGAVHDSYWCHAADVDDMHRDIRDCFIELHSRPLLHELRDYLATNPLYQDATVPLPPVPQQGDLNLDDIRHSIYFFS